MVKIHLDWNIAFKITNDRCVARKLYQQNTPALCSVEEIHLTCVCSTDTAPLTNSNLGKYTVFNKINENSPLTLVARF